MEKTVIVVGNAPIKDMGEKIDSFDIICRLQSYTLEAIKGYERDVGKRTHILFEYKPTGTPPGTKFVKFDKRLKTRMSKEADTYIRSGVLAIFQALKMFGSPITTVGFEFSNDKPISIFHEKRQFSYHDLMKDSAYLQEFNVQEKIRCFGVTTYEEPEAEGRLVEKYISSGDLKWLE